MTDTPVAATEGGLLPQIERWFFGELNDSQRRLLFVFTVGHAAAAEATAHSIQRRLLRKIVEDATRTPSPCSLGEDVVRRIQLKDVVLRHTKVGGYPDTTAIAEQERRDG